LLNKCDLLNEDQRRTVVGVLRNLNPKARIIEAVRGAVDPRAILATGLFSMDEASAQPGWLEIPRGSEQPETDEYGITSFVYRARRPFHARRVWSILDFEQGALAGVLRSKGFMWIASQHDQALSWSQAGVSVQINPVGMWWGAVSPEDWPEDTPENAELLRDIQQDFEGSYGDRRQELVFIGLELDRTRIETLLDSCLLTDAEMAAGPEGWCHFDDPIAELAALAPDSDMLTDEASR
jgi:G3E family GTPase